MFRNAPPRIFACAWVLLLVSAARGAAGGPYVFYSVTPCRLVDTRDLPGPSGGPALSNNTVRNFPVRGSLARNCGVSPFARAAALNVAVIQPGFAGHITLFPAGQFIPGTSTINYNAGEVAIANGALAELADFADYQLAVHTAMGGAGTAHLVIDITGYFQAP